jgi:hypothetical protein
MLQYEGEGKWEGMERKRGEQDGKRRGEKKGWEGGGENHNPSVSPLCG